MDPILISEVSHYAENVERIHLFHNVSLRKNIDLDLLRRFSVTT